MTSIEFSVTGIGAWGNGFYHWNSLAELLNGGVLDIQAAATPKPEVIPSNERRRAPLPVKLAVETSWQATQMAQSDPKDLPCVFVSGLGDTQLTDYMCRVLAGEDKALSPTKFHNSVHNAAAGYWTISTGCMQSANSVAGFEESVSLALMEALIQAQSLNAPLLLTFYDAPSSELLMPLLKNQQPFAFSLVIEPSVDNDKSFKYKAEIDVQKTNWPNTTFVEGLQHCYQFNPVGRILSFAKIIATNEEASLSMPLSAETALKITKSTR